MVERHVALRLSALGDLVLCSAFAAELSRRRPGEPFTFVTSAGFADFVRASFPAALEAEGLARPRFGLLGWFLRGLALARRLAQAGDRLRLYDLHGVGKTRAMSWGFRLDAWRRGYTLRILRTPKRSALRALSVVLGRDLIGPRHVYREHLALLDAEFPEARAPQARPRLLVPPPGREASAGAPRFLIAPDASRWKKRWPVEAWEKLLERLLSEWPQARLTLVGNAQALPQDLRDDLAERHGERVEDLIGRTALADLPAVAARHALVVCGNSGWLHVAEATGVPAVALAGPIVPGFGFSPWRPDSQELSVELDCRPCTRHGGGICRRVGTEFHACMRFIRPEDVLGAVRRALAARELRA